MEKLKEIIKLPSDNPEWVWEVYDKDTGLFLCYYLSKTKKTKTQKSMKTIQWKWSEKPF